MQFTCFHVYKNNNNNNNTAANRIEENIKTITLWQKRRKNILKYINMYMYTCSFERNMLSLKKSLEKIKIL